MTIEEAIINTIGKRNYDGFIEAGVSSLSILENACLTAFLFPAGGPDSTSTLKEALALVWNKPPGPLNLKQDIEGLK